MNCTQCFKHIFIVIIIIADAAWLGRHWLCAPFDELIFIYLFIFEPCASSSHLMNFHLQKPNGVCDVLTWSCLTFIIFLACVAQNAHSHAHTHSLPAGHIHPERGIFILFCLNVIGDTHTYALAVRGFYSVFFKTEKCDFCLTFDGRWSCNGISSHTHMQDAVHRHRTKKQRRKNFNWKIFYQTVCCVM